MRRVVLVALGALALAACGTGDGGARSADDTASIDDPGASIEAVEVASESSDEGGVPDDAYGPEVPPAETTDVPAADDHEVVAPGCRTDAPSALATCVDADTYAADLALVARERPCGSPGLEVVRAHCQQVLEAAGFQVERQALYDGENVIGVLPGTTRADERVVISAHADHIEDCPGADDNASGVAAVLGAARALSLATYERTLVVACWDGEELGLEGSAAWADRAAAEGDDLVAVYVLDMLAYVDHAPGSQEMPAELQLLAPTAFKEVQQNGSRGDFLAILADPGTLKAANLFAAAATAAGALTYVLKIPDALKMSDEAADLRNSDHASFWAAGFSALAVNDTGPLRNPYLHCAGGPDTIATLDVGFAVGATRGLVASAAEILGLRVAHP